MNLTSLDSVPYVSIVIPAYNEEESLPFFLHELEDALLTISKRFTIENNMLRDCNDPGNIFPPMEVLLEVLIVDDGSTDGTARILSEYARSRSYVKTLALSRNQGQTQCFKKAFAEIKGQYVIRLDSDLQNDPKDLIKFFHNFTLSGSCHRHSEPSRSVTPT